MDLDEHPTPRPTGEPGCSGNGPPTQSPRIRKNLRQAELVGEVFGSEILEKWSGVSEHYSSWLHQSRDSSTSKSPAFPRLATVRRCGQLTMPRAARSATCWNQPTRIEERDQMYLCRMIDTEYVHRLPGEHLANVLEIGQRIRTPKNQTAW